MAAATPSSASAAAADKAQRQTDSVFRFIKLFADAPRRAETPKPRPRTDVASPAPRRPDTTSVAASASPEKSEASVEPLQVAAYVPPAQTNVPGGQGAPEGNSTPEAVAEATVDDEPEELRIIEMVQPVVPRRFESNSDSEKVRIAFSVAMDGSVSNVSVVSATDKKLGRPAAEAVAKWRFAPLKEVRTAQVEIGFKLD